MTRVRFPIYLNPQTRGPDEDVAIVETTTADQSGLSLDRFPQEVFPRFRATAGTPS